MNKLNLIKIHSSLNLSDQQNSGYFNSEIHKKTMSKKLSKYMAVFDYNDKTLIVLSVARGRISITSFTSVIEIPARIASASFTFIFSSTTGIIKKSLKVTRKK